jgi:hypothetical protein
MTRNPLPDRDRPRAAWSANPSDIEVSQPVSIAGLHLLDGDLLAPSPSARKHLTECGWCRQRQQVAERHRDELDDEDFLHAARHRAEAGGAAALASITRLTPTLHALTVDTAVREDVAVGQLWRLRWEQASELAVVLAVDRWWVTVAPATADVSAADDLSLLLPRTASVLNIALAVCVSLECTVPLFVFDRLIAPASRPTIDSEEAAAHLPPPDTLRDVWRAWRRSTPGPENLAYGTALDDGDLDRRELRAAISSSFTVLVGASASIPGDLQGEVVPLAQRVRNLEMRPTDLAAATGLPSHLFTRINRGGRVNRTEAEQLSPLLSVDPQTVLNGNPALDDGLITEVSQPRHRPALRRLAHATSTSEDAQRWTTADAVSPQAARAVNSQQTTGAGSSPPNHWAAKVDNYLKQRLAELDETL